jgi:hypothetical protein
VRLGVTLLVLLTACLPPRRAGVGVECEVNSECDTPLVCRLGHCRNECATSADCAAGLSCVLDPSGVGACQLAAETDCTMASECPEGLVCRFMQCTNACETDRDCPGGSRCEADGAALACIDRSGVPCTFDEECDPIGTGERCIARRCRRECFSDRDCRNDFRCSAGQCTPPPTVTYDCGAFDEDAGWTVRAGFRAVVVADAADGLDQPAGLTFAGGPYGRALYVTSSMTPAVLRVDVDDGTTTPFTADAAWGGLVPTLLTSIVWDEGGVRDGALYVGEQGTGLDNDAAVYRIGADGLASLVIAGPGPGLDDVYAMAFSPPGSPYPQGLYLAGDTDNLALPDWGLVVAASSTAFSELAGIEGLAFDPTGLYGGSLWAARPGGSGYGGDSTITPITSAGTAGTPILTGEVGVHGVTFSLGGPFGARMYAASWSSQSVIEIAPDGTRTELASGLMFDNYDGNVVAVSRDGEVMLVADRLADRVVCIEPL